MSLQAPFPYFGGKRRVAKLVWARFGDVASYNEPFYGSGAVLLGRPTEPRIETVNDVDAYLCNFWRAIAWDPDAVAYWADSPVSETDIHARHRWLVLSKKARASMARVKADAEYFDVKIAGWWVHGICAWIGSGWCQTARPEDSEDWSRRPPNWNQGVHAGTITERYGRPGRGWEQERRPQLSAGQGVHAKRPYLGGHGGGTGINSAARRRWQGGGAGGGSGVHRPSLHSSDWQQVPDLSGSRGAAGRGVHAMRHRRQRPWEQTGKRPHLSNGKPDEPREGVGRGVHSGRGREGLYDWFDQLAARLRNVRVCCGDWERILTRSVTTYIGVTGVFLDPPYAHDLRERCYAEDHDISTDVRRWALDNGENPMMRIALCGYEQEHGPHMPAKWECVPWKAHGGYSRSARGKANRTAERIWFSPHCLRPSESLLSLLEDADDDAEDVPTQGLLEQ